MAKVSQQPEKTLQKALQLAQEIEDQLSLAMASAELGQIYEQQQKYDLALSYTEAAEQYIYPLLIYDYLYQYQWQEARIYEGLNQPEKAKSAYRRSLDSLQKIRPQIANAGKNVQFDFQESIEPIYRGLLKLLLRDRPSQSDLQQSLQVFEHVMGLAGIAIRIGIPSVLSSIWSVSDLTTPKMIEDFYQYWKSGQNKASALQKVQIEQIHQKSHPSIWASFVLIGI